jgi:hypothetical protein
VAIRAQQDALLDLRTETIDAVRSAASDSELLCRWVDMVELKSSKAAIVTAQGAAAAVLDDQ